MYKESFCEGKLNVYCGPERMKSGNGSGKQQKEKKSTVGKKFRNVQQEGNLAPIAIFQVKKIHHQEHKMLRYRKMRPKLDIWRITCSSTHRARRTRRQLEVDLKQGTCCVRARRNAGRGYKLRSQH